MADPIKIDRIHIKEIVLPLKVPFQISGGIMRTRRSIIVELHSGGAIGYGESAPFEQPFYSSETIGSVVALYKDLLIGRIEGRAFATIEDFNAALTVGVRGNPFARCGFENAFWDLCSAIRKKSYTELIADQMERLGVAAEHRVPAGRVASGVAIGIPEDGKIETLRKWVEEYRAEGYQRVKIKIRPGWDEAACRVSREALGAEFMLWPDANSSYDLREHLAELKKLDAFNLAFIEQPLHHDDLLDHAALGRQIATPVCLDESLKSARVARQALDCGSSRIWNIKVQRVGGLLEAIKIYAVAAANGVKLWGGTMPESGIGAQAILALAQFPAFVYPADIEPSTRWYEAGVDPLEISMSRDGWITVPNFHGVDALIERERYSRARVIV